MAMPGSSDMSKPPGRDTVLEDPSSLRTVSSMRTCRTFQPAAALVAEALAVVVAAAAAVPLRQLVLQKVLARDVQVRAMMLGRRRGR